MRIITVFLFSLLLFACNEEKKASEQSDFENFDEVKEEKSSPMDEKRMVVLTIKATPSSTVLIEQSLRGTILSDSVFTDANGDFSGQFQFDNLGFYRTIAKDLPAALLIIDSDSIYVDMTVENKDYALIGNSSESNNFLEYQKIAAKYSQKFDEVRANGGDQVAVYIDRKNEIKQYILDKSPSFSALNAINEFYNTNELSFLTKVSDAFKNSEDAMVYAKPFVDGVNEMKKQEEVSPTKLGTTVLNFELKNVNGIVTEFAQVDGKYILVDFWASWCGPCRKENPNVKKVYNEYRDKGLSILSISLDTDKDAWKRAIEDDLMNWNHMIDERDPSKSVANKYGITNIPFMLLLDENYKIIAKNLRGIELEAQITELLGK